MKGNKTKDKVNSKQAKDITLTSRELDVLDKIIKGLTDVEISEELKISRYTVSDHRKKIIEKFKAKNSCQLVYLACVGGYV